MILTATLINFTVNFAHINIYLFLIFHSVILRKQFKTLIQTKPMVMLVYYSYAEICSATITTPLYIFKHALAAASFPCDWEKK